MLTQSPAGDEGCIRELGTMRTVIAAGLAILLATPPCATAEERDIRGSAERLAAAVRLQPDPVGNGRAGRKIATTLALVGAGVGLVLASNPQYVPSRFAPGNMPRRVDLSVYLGAGDYPGHSYRLTPRRGTAFGTGYACPASATRCAIGASELEEQYEFGFTDGHDAGRYEGLVAGHEDGFAAGWAAAIRIMDAKGVVVFEGVFRPASYVAETFSDRKLMRYGGAGLIAAGALLGLFWPRPGNLTVTPLPGGGQVAASLGF